MLSEIVRFGLPLVLIFGFAFVVSTSDRFIIEHYYGDGQVGIYSAGYNLMDRITTLIFMMVATPAFPLLIHKLEHEGEESASTQSYHSGVAMLVLAPACVGLMLCNGPLTAVLSGLISVRHGQVMPWIAVSALLVVCPRTILTMPFISPSGPECSCSRRGRRPFEPGRQFPPHPRLWLYGRRVCQGAVLRAASDAEHLRGAASVSHAVSLPARVADRMRRGADGDRIKAHRLPAKHLRAGGHGDCGRCGLWCSPARVQCDGRAAGFAIWCWGSPSV